MEMREIATRITNPRLVQGGTSMDEFTIGILDCLSDRDFVTNFFVSSVFCGPCTSAVQGATLESRDVSLVDMCYFAMCPPCANYTLRGTMAERYHGIGERSWGHCSYDLIVASTCLLPCAIEQQIREMELNDDAPRSCFG